MKLILIYISPHFSLGNEELEVTEVVILQFQLFLTCHGTQSFYKTGAFANLSHNHSFKIIFWSIFKVNCKIYIWEEGVDVLFHIHSTECNQKLWYVFLKQTKEDSERCRGERLVRELGMQGMT